MRERRFKKVRFPKKAFLVICEGETEKEYVETLKRFYRLPITIKTKVSGNSISRRLVNQYITEVGLISLDNNIFYIYDADVKHVVDTLDTLPGKKILTNPCFELWFLLHIKACTSYQDSNMIIRMLKSSHPGWKNYIKGVLNREQEEILINNRLIAAARSKKLLWPQNPSSNLHDFIETLEKEKKSEFR